MGVNTVDVILKLTGPDYHQNLVDLAQFALDNFGAGGNPDSDKEEGFIGWGNVLVKQGYVRSRISQVYGQALEYLAANGGSPHAELIEVQWDGPQSFVLPEPDEEGNPTLLGEF